MIFSWFLFIKFCSKIGIRIIPFGKVEWNQLVVADLFGPYELVRPNRSLLYSSDIYRSWYCFSDRVSNAVILGEPGCLHSTCKPFDTKKLWIHLIWSLISCVASIRRPSDFFNQNSCPKFTYTYDAASLVRMKIWSPASQLLKLNVRSKIWSRSLPVTSVSFGKKYRK